MERFEKRTTYAGELRADGAGERVTLNGWIAGRRDLGGLVFVDVRDHTGFSQVVFSPQHAPELMDEASTLRDEFVVSVTGEVRMRENPNDSTPTGAVEIYAEGLAILNRADVPPFDTADRTKSSEELRLRHRYVELRHPDLQRTLRIRNQITQVVHSYFESNRFVEIETPLLVRATPEGARDYVVPSRVHPGKFYALPQSPQIYKQLLMIAGFDRYVQIAKCLRDEDLRADRQPEFTQIDMEMAFVDRDDVLSMTEGFLAALWQEVRGVDISTPLDRLTYREAMERYGTDKPDRRFGLELIDCSDLFSETEFGVFSGTLESDGTIVGLSLPGGAKYSRKIVDELTEYVKRYGARGLVWMKVTSEGLEAGSSKFLSDSESLGLRERLGAGEGDMIFMIADEWKRSRTALGALRLELGRREDLIDRSVDDMFYVVDFPMFEDVDPETGHGIPAHHPFTSARPEDLDRIESDPASVRANQYDLVVNGYETASGSIRIHDVEDQYRALEATGLTREQADEKFGFLLDALKSGAPPHGGIALGLDRLAMILGGTSNIRDVVAFPKTTSAASLMDDAPSTVDPAVVAELGLSLSSD